MNDDDADDVHEEDFEKFRTFCSC